MALWALTKAEIIRDIEIIFRRLSGREAPTFGEKKVMENALNAAIIDICMDRGISRWRFMQSACTASTTASTAYVDLTANIFNIISNTVRIEAENLILRPASLEFIYASDPDQDNEGTPQYYALDASSDPETIRMHFKPIPDAAYTIDFVGESIPDEDSVSSLPSWAHALLKDKATANALRDLGYIPESTIFEHSYSIRRADQKASQGYDGPIHIRKKSWVVHRGLESRLPEN